ncbi:unnamed protein product [Prorocentrum cordatum]|uniref:Uncharacterized protein n=1 Tax=Prorocentrum cordatum TaxID=2364126 RepID=A0ABN9VWU6_9DINO|nr:unnamed protein product [Polarella glacialis]
MAAMAAKSVANDATSNEGPVLEGKEAMADHWSCTPSGLQAALDSYGWVMHLGPFSVGRNGVDVKPQLKFGGQVGNVVAEVGMGDVRDGLRFESGVRAFAEAEGSGHSLEELHADVRRRLGENAASMGSAIGAMANSAKVDEVLEAASRVLGSSAKGLGSRTGEIARRLGVDAADLDRTLAGEAASGGEANLGGERPPMTLRVRASTGLGASCQVSLGWCDTSGYHMVGLGMEAVALVSTGGNLFAGRHRSGVGLKILLGVSNFMLEYTFPGARPAGAPQGAPRGLPAAAQQGPLLPAGADAAGAGSAGAAGGGAERAEGPLAR